jgi:hypothetical protein
MKRFPGFLSIVFHNIIQSSQHVPPASPRAPGFSRSSHRHVLRQQLRPVTIFRGYSRYAAVGVPDISY